MKEQWRKIAEEVVELLAIKNEYYGNTFETIQDAIIVLLSRYKGEDGVFHIPENVLRNLLVIVRIMDKISRIVGGNLGTESAWIDIIGYCLLAENLERRRQKS